MQLPLLVASALAAAVATPNGSSDWTVIDQVDDAEVAVDDASARRTAPGVVRVTLRMRYTRATAKNAPLWTRGVRATLLDQEVECAGGQATRLRVHRVWLADAAGQTIAEKPAPATWIPATRPGSFGATSGRSICGRFRPAA
jgi:hypothetical protein